MEYLDSSLVYHAGESPRGVDFIFAMTSSVTKVEPIDEENVKERNIDSVESFNSNNSIYQKSKNIKSGGDDTNVQTIKPLQIEELDRLVPISPLASIN